MLPDYIFFSFLEDSVERVGVAALGTEIREVREDLKRRYVNISNNGSKGGT